MPHPNELKVDEWYRKAEDDELSIKAILKDQSGAPSTVCFLSQQMAEKYLKAFLVDRKKEFPKIHQLDRLLALCIEIEPDLIRLKDESINITGYYAETRYPGDFIDFTWDEAKQSFQSAITIKDLIKAKIKK